MKCCLPQFCPIADEQKCRIILDHYRITDVQVREQMKYDILELYMSLCVRKPTICMGENKDADQLRGNREADQRLCFRYTDSTFPPLLIPKFSRFWVSSVTVQAGLCWTWSETQIVGFVMHRLICHFSCLGIFAWSWTEKPSKTYIPNNCLN